MSWSELPAEILYVIFNNIGNLEGISRSQTVCKNWSVPAQHVLYEKLWFVDRHQQQFIKFIHSMKAHPSHRGQLAKAVHFGSSYSQQTNNSTGSYIFELAKLCPNIEDIIAFSPVPAFYRELACASMFYWKNLKRIPRPSVSSFEPIDYSLCVLQSQPSLQQVSISKAFCNNEFGRDFLKRLNEFSCLKNIHVLEPLRPNELNTILQRIPCASALDLVSIDDLDGYDYSRPSAPCKHIKSIEGLSVSFEEPLMDYFMDKFPKLEFLEMYLNLSIFCLRTDYQCRPSRFLKYISKIPKFNIRIVLPSFELTKSILTQIEPTALSVYLDSKKIEISQKNSAGSEVTVVYRPPSTATESIVNGIGAEEGRREGNKVTDDQIVQILEDCGYNLEWLNLNIMMNTRSFENPLNDVCRLCPKLKAFDCFKKSGNWRWRVGND
ncbi:hypothetical protein G6F56_007651 [Rhizopus delemar]|uniref:F-box domain-containing protein n=1 Tax=Rhizopus stolonifer TaxID=4846 RepID=A0A367JB33_RHIST|nr:hypothetical protein G6F56_007651 [Rhizopus delemar]RCH87153.1 hypothetical protein CU098_004528 [Rhizopus stolonifer]